MNNQTQTETQTELDKDLFDIMDDVETAIVELQYTQTLLNEAIHDVEHVIKYDGSDEDERRKATLLARRPVLETFLAVSLDYLHNSLDSLKSVALDLYEQARGGND